jgi:hypothetical protein
MPNGKHKVVSGPAKFDSAIGKVVTIKKGQGTSGEKGSKTGSKTGKDDTTIEDLLQFSNLADIKELIKSRNDLVREFEGASGNYEDVNGKMVKIKDTLKRKIGNLPGVVPSRLGKSLYGDASYGSQFEEYDQKIAELEKEQKSCIEQLYSKLEEALKYIYDMMLDGATENAEQGLESCRAFLKLYYAIHNAICYGKAPTIKPPNSIRKGTYEYAIFLRMDAPYGSNVVQGTVYRTFYNMLGIVDKIIKEKDPSKRELALSKQVVAGEGGFLQQTKSTFDI